MPAGEADAEGDFPEGTFNRRVVDRLERLARIHRAKGEAEEPDEARLREGDADGGDATDT
jgi:hypothetical protein